MAHHQHSDYVETVAKLGPHRLSSGKRTLFLIMAAIGIVTFLVAIFVGRPRYGWIAFLHNLYFFSTLAAAGVVVAAIIQVARAMWGRPIKRFAEAMGSFLPVTFVGIIILYFGGDHLYEWMAVGVDADFYPNKATWFTPVRFFGLQLLAVALLIFVANKFRSLSLRPDLGVAHEHAPDLWEQPRHWAGADEEVKKAQAAMSKWGVFYCIAFAVIVSLMAYDLIKSLDYRWVSTMFGGWNMTTSILAAFATLVWITHFMSNRFGLQKYMHPKLYHDLGKLTFGFTVVWGYLFFAQFLVIWYGNLSHETGYLKTRFYGETWRPIALLTFALIWLIPFILGLGKKWKMSPKTFGPIALISLVGIWFERFMLIAPATLYYDRETMQFTGSVGYLLTIDVLVFIGFAGIFALCFTNYLYKNPVMPISDPRLDEGINRH